MNDTELLNTLDKLLPAGKRWKFQAPDRDPTITVADAPENSDGASWIRAALTAAVSKLQQSGRVPGYYWVRRNKDDKWMIGEWSNDFFSGGMRWHLTGNSSPFDPDYFEVGPRVDLALYLRSAGPASSQRYTGVLESGRQLRWEDKLVTVEALVDEPSSGDTLVTISWYSDRPTLIQDGDNLQMVRSKYVLTLPSEDFRENAMEPISFSLQGSV